MATGNVKVRNSDTHDLFVTIRDLNTANHKSVWVDERLNSNESKSVSVEINGSGFAKLNWKARNVDDAAQPNEEEEEVDDGGEMLVRA